MQVHNAAGTGFLTGVEGIGAGFYHSLAINNGGALVSLHQAWAWGGNQFGQIGDDTVCNEDTGTNCAKTRPVAVKAEGGPGNLINVAKVVGGRFQSAALSTASTALGWGYNGHGQLYAAGDFKDRSRPHPMAIDPGLLDIAVGAGGNHTLLLKSNLTVAGKAAVRDGRGRAARLARQRLRPGGQRHDGATASSSPPAAMARRRAGSLERAPPPKRARPARASEGPTGTSGWHGDAQRTSAAAA